MSNDSSNIKTKTNPEQYTLMYETSMLAACYGLTGISSETVRFIQFHGRL